MKLYTTRDGIARAEGELLALLDVPERDLGEVLANGRLDALARASVKTHAPLATTSLESPVLAPATFVIAGLNYRAHCEEIGRAIPESLAFLFVEGGAENAPRGEIRLPADASAHVDYEAELAFVIGRPAESIRAEHAWDYIAGICALNDVSARDVQASGGLEGVQRAKGYPTFKPFGPCLVTADALTLPLDLAITTRVNGEPRQSARTTDMVFGVPEILEAVSARRALQPGDVVCTGTPGGVAHGGRFPYLVAGDVVEVELEGVGSLVQRVVAPDA